MKREIEWQKGKREREKRHWFSTQCWKRWVNIAVVSGCIEFSSQPAQVLYNKVVCLPLMTRRVTMFSLPSSLPPGLQVQLCHLLHCVATSISFWPPLFFSPSCFSPVSAVAVSWQDVGWWHGGSCRWVRGRGYIGGQWVLSGPPWPSFVYPFHTVLCWSTFLLPPASPVTL